MLKISLVIRPGVFFEVGNYDVFSAKYKAPFAENTS